MVLRPPFEGSASGSDGIGGGGGSSGIGGGGGSSVIGGVDWIDDVAGGAPTCLTNMAVPCVGQTQGVN
jgi:hypothetical protein